MEGMRVMGGMAWHIGSRKGKTCPPGWPGGGWLAHRSPRRLRWTRMEPRMGVISSLRNLLSSSPVHSAPAWTHDTLFALFALDR